MPDNVLNTDVEITEDIDVSKTYNLTEKKIQGNIDQLGALQQAIYKILNTGKYEYQIYRFDYVIALESLIGKEANYVRVELKRRIQECLLNYERIISVDNFNFATKGDNLTCTFEVVSIYGEMIVTKEVEY